MRVPEQEPVRARVRALPAPERVQEQEQEQPPAPEPVRRALRRNHHRTRSATRH